MARGREPSRLLTMRPVQVRIGMAGETADFKVVADEVPAQGVDHRKTPEGEVGFAVAAGMTGT